VLYARHMAAPDDAPTFTGDVPDDIVETERAIQHRILRQARTRKGRFGFPAAAGLLTYLGVTSLHARVHPAWAAHPGRDVLVGAAVIAVLATAVAFVTKIPAPVRFVLGLVPAACAFFLGGLGSRTPTGLQLLLTYGAVLAAGAFVLVAGIRMHGWARTQQDRLRGRGSP
jgi:hypothetical protein